MRQQNKVKRCRDVETDGAKKSHGRRDSRIRNLGDRPARADARLRGKEAAAELRRSREENERESDIMTACSVGMSKRRVCRFKKSKVAIPCGST